MCGRYSLKANPEDLISLFSLDECADLESRYNILPGTDASNRYICKI